MSSGVAFSIFGIDVFWYGIMYAIGFLLVYLYFQKYFITSSMSEDNKDSAFIIIALSSLISARLFFTFFYFPMYYFENPLHILRVMDGGMSIHGGLIGFFIGSYIVSKRYNFSIYKITDFFMLPAILAMAFGRLGNFINQELPGIPTDSMFGVVFSEVDDLKRFPYQLFAGFTSLITFHIVLYLYMFKKLREGILTYITIFLYSIFRFLLDFMREPTTLFLNFPLGQWFSLLVIGISVIMIYKILTSEDNVKGSFNSKNNQNNIKRTNKNNIKNNNKKRDRK
ncbi:MAG: prolipoprotein diacylglyceryl transferase [Nanoarchaeota archaeon]|nr:prolipoprotein diacylglyceryl transferase [Nanoarchaeota archaeon]